MRKIQRTAFLAMSVALSLAGASYAQVMEKVPADALAVLKVSNLAATSAKIAKLANTLGVNAFVPELNDPLGALKAQMKITDGLKDDGEVAIVYVDPKGGDEDKSVLILIPTSDYKALVGGIEGATTDGALTVKKAEDGSDTFIADWNGYAAISPTKELVATAPSKTLTLPARASKELTGTDLTLFANFAALREPLTADLAKNREQAKTQMMQELKDKGQVPEKFHPAASAAFDQVFLALESFLRDTDAATVGLTLTDTGIKQNVIAEFKGNSYIGNWVNSLKNSNETLLSNLPTGKYLVYGGMAISAKPIGQLIDDASGPIVKALPQDDENLKLVPEYLTDLKAMFGNMQSVSYGMLTPQGAIGQEGIVQFLASTKGDGAKILESQKKFNDKYAKVTNDLVGGAQGMEMKQTYTEGAKEIAGVKFDSISTEIIGDSPVANQQRQAMQLAYGSAKPEFFVANTGDEVLTFVGATDDTVAALIAAAKNNEAPLAKGEAVAAVTGALPKARLAETYVAVDEIVAFALRAANQFGFVQGNIQLPPDLQPIGIGIASENNALEITGYVSNDLLQALVSAGFQAASMMNGGGGRPGGGL